jgi:hypothetical protein
MEVAKDEPTAHLASATNAQAEKKSTPTNLIAQALLHNIPTKLLALEKNAKQQAPPERPLGSTAQYPVELEGEYSDDEDIILLARTRWICHQDIRGL